MDGPHRFSSKFFGPRGVVALIALLLLAVGLGLGQDQAPTSSAPPAAPASPAQPSTSVPAYRQAGNVAIITIHGEIDGDRMGGSIMAKSVIRRIQKAVDAGAQAIVFDLDTPGGSVPAVLDICTAIKKCPIQNTVAWVNPNAYSGGAIIALACREMIINDPATMGDAMPIGFDPLGGASAIQEKELLRKVLPPLIADVVDSCRRTNEALGEYKRDEFLAQAIVANDVELWWVQNPATGQKMCIDRDEFEMLFPGEPTSTITRLAGVPGGFGNPPGNAASPAAPQTGGPLIVKAPSGSRKLAAAAANISSTTVSIIEKSRRPTLTPADKGQWVLIEKISDGTAPALFKADDMLFFGLAANTTKTVGGRETVVPIASDADVAAFFGAKSVGRIDKVWSEYMVSFLTNFIVRGLLIVIFLIALFVEMTHPGVMLPGAIAAVALILLIAPPMLIGMAGWWTIAAILAGIVLIALEIFVIPGFGVTGVLGLLLLFVGLVGSFTSSGSLFPTSPREKSDLMWGATTVILSTFTALVGMYFIGKHFGSLPLLGRLVLKTPGTGDDEAEAMLVAMDPDADEPARIGEKGVAVTPLRPAGRVQIGDRIVDAVAEFGYIPSGTAVRVSSVSQFRIGVERSEAAT